MTSSSDEEAQKQNPSTENSTLISQTVLDESYDDQYETVREQFIHELGLLPSRLITLQKELLKTHEMRRTNQLLSQENSELCSDIQDLITENRDLILENERFAKIVQSQQQKIQELEEDLEKILLTQDDLLNREEKKLDSEYKLKFKIHAAALERAQLLSAVHRLEEERDEMSEKIKKLLAENERLNSLITQCMVGKVNETHMATVSTAIRQAKDGECPRMNQSSFINRSQFHCLAPRLQKLDANEHMGTRDNAEKTMTEEAPLYNSTTHSRRNKGNNRRRSENDLKEEKKQNSFLDWIRSDKFLPKARSLLIHPKRDNDNSILNALQTKNFVVDDSVLSYGPTEHSSQNSIKEEWRNISHDKNIRREGDLLVDFGCGKSIDSDSVTEEHAWSENNFTTKYKSFSM
jgi:hypothetical protein